MEGVVAYLEDSENQTRLVFDDVSSSESAHPDSWRKTVIYTSGAYNRELLDNLELTQEQYAEIGQNVVFRLLALNKRIK